MSAILAAPLTCNPYVGEQRHHDALEDEIALADDSQRGLAPHLLSPEPVLAGGAWSASSEGKYEGRRDSPHVFCKHFRHDRVRAVQQIASARFPWQDY